MLKELDRFQSVVLKVSEFGLVQMTRKRSGKTLQQELTNDCRNCHGSGFVRSIQTECFDILRKLEQEIAAVDAKSQVTIHVHQEVFDYITKKEYNAILALEKRFDGKIIIESKPTLKVYEFKIEINKK